MIYVTAPELYKEKKKLYPFEVITAPHRFKSPAKFYFENPYVWFHYFEDEDRDYWMFKSKEEENLFHRWRHGK